MATKIQDYSKYLSKTSAKRKFSPIREVYPLISLPGMISLAGGLPNVETFPVKSATFRMKQGPLIELDQNQIDIALQYGDSVGNLDLIKWVSDLQEHVHHPPHGMKDRGVLLGSGSQDLMHRSLDMLLNEGDTCLVEFPTYSGCLAILHPMGCNVVGVEIDGDGMIPSALRKILAENKGKKPKVLYMIPTGSNPSGASLTLERKKEIYKIAQQHDLIIVEDDPYYYLTFGDLIPSFLSLDVDGRVIRLDSFSKMVAPGLRVGMVTAPTFFIMKMNMFGQINSQHPSGLSQMFLLALLQRLGIEGFLKLSKDVAKFYENRAILFAQSADKHLKGLAEWTVPNSGMFYWIKLLGVEDAFSLIKTRAIEEKVLLIPGSAFSPNGEKSAYVRANFSLETPERIDEALRRLALLIKGASKL